MRQLYISAEQDMTQLNCNVLIMRLSNVASRLCEYISFFQAYNLEDKTGRANKRVKGFKYR